jgi:hypothetical protein
MASFDIMQAVFNAYQTIWRERIYLLRLGAVPFLIAYLNFVGVSLIDADIIPLRRSILLLPAMIAEAWLVCQFLRTLMTGERWPIMRPVNDAVPATMVARVRGLLSAMIAYLLIVLTMNVFAGVVATLWATGTLQKMVESGNPAYTIANFVVLFLLIRWFKIFWIHVPLVINLPMRRYLQSLPGWMPSIHLIGLWLASALPIMVMALGVIGVLEPLGAGESLGAFIGFMILKFFDVSAQLGISLVSSTAAAFAIQPLFFSKSKK